VNTVTRVTRATTGPMPPDPEIDAGPGTARRGIELRHLRYFVAVADSGTFTQAADRIFIAQPTLSQQIRRLEEMIGTPLLQRRREGVRLTTAGTVLLEESRTVLSLVDHGLARTRQAAGLGRTRVRVVVPPGLPESLAVATASRLRSAAAAADVDLTWLEAPLDTEFSLIRQRRADAGLGWIATGDDALPASLDLMKLGEFEPQAWVPSAHPAAACQVIGLDELASMEVIHGPRGLRPGIYDAWHTAMRATRPRFDFTDPPFRQSLPMTLAFAASASQPTAVLTGPQCPIGAPNTARDDQTEPNGMVPVRIERSPLDATAGLVWSADLPRPLQQILFDAADGIVL
jgi:DNA-binding transcriptional LysR family regulator